MIYFLAWAVQAQEVSFSGSLGSTIDDVVISADASEVAFIGSNTSHVLATDTWQVTEVTACGVLAMGGGVYIEEKLYIGCDDGTVSAYYNGTVTQNVFTLDGATVLGLWSDNDLLYVLAESDSGGNPRVHAIDIETKQESSGNYPSTLGYSGYTDAEIIGNYLIISQGNASVSKVDLSSGAASRDNQGPTAVSQSDVLNEPSGTNALIAGGDGGIVRFLTASNDTQYALNLATWTDITALAIWDDYIWLADGQTLRAHDVSGFGATIGTEERESIDLESPVLEMVALEEHLVYVAADGTYGIVGDLPWIEISTLEVDSGIYTLEFVSDTAGDFSVYLGDESGTELGSGTAEANETTKVAFDEPTGLIEGDNRIWVQLAGGHDAIMLTVDNPPEAIVLAETALASGNQKLTLSFEGLSAVDIASYQIYLTTEVFSASDYTTGGPEFSVLSEEALLFAASASMVVDLYPLENHTQYYLGVRAIDSAGTEGPMSNVINAEPKPSYNVSSLSNESGGFEGCSHTQKSGLGFFLLLGCAGLIFRRNSLMAVLFAISFFGMGTPAYAADTFGEHKPVFSNAVLIDYSMTKFDSGAIQSVFGSESLFPGVNLTASLQALRVFEISSSLGVWRQTGLMVQEDGTSSSDEETMMIAPLQLSAGLRVHIFDDQIIVPFASSGIDYWLWKENWKEGEVEMDVSGGKAGWHYRFGVELLLDLFDKSSASMLDVRYQIKDTYLTFAYQKQSVGTEGLLFDGESYLVGLRMQY